MKNYKIARILWLLTGLFALLTFILNIISNVTVLLPVLNGIVFVLALVCAYINHKKIMGDNKDDKCDAQ